LTQKVSIPLYLQEIEPGNYHLFIEVKVGRKKVRLLLDTGASKTAFDTHKILELVQATNKEHTEMNSVGLGSNQVNTHLRELTSMRFGEIKLKKVEVAVLDLSHVNHAYQMLGIEEISGVLGSDLLVKLKASINLEKMILRLKSNLP
jgi:predicted aspartyl protease